MFGPRWCISVDGRLGNDGSPPEPPPGRWLNPDRRFAAGVADINRIRRNTRRRP
ncbi:hypothetical protein ACIA5A_06090 [Micromonospora sp. NPDC051300]|uniref:hypothetical protein n=1 Tax=Micromonospora sp. NPDC051300 TaxID=3364286 RepID=UPI0037AF5AB1